VLLLVLLGASTSLEAHSVPEGTLRVGINNFPASLGNPYRGNGPPGTFIWYALFDGLTQLDERGRLVPALALSWALREPTLWRFELRPGVRYANGRPFDAYAATSILSWLISKDGRATVIGNELRVVLAAQAISPLVLEIRTREPDPILPKRLVGALMVEPDTWARLGPEGFALQPVGTGPWVLERWDQRARRAYARLNPYRWRHPHFARIEFLELRDSAVRTQALLSRDVNIASVEIEALARLESRGYSVVVAPAMSVMSLAFITQRATPGPLQDQRVRQALNYAVDKDAIARTLLRGYSRAAGQPAPSITFGYDPTLAPYPYDPERARRLLAEAGYPHGFTLTAEILTGVFPADGLIYQALAHYLRQVGVEVRLQVITFPQYLRNMARNSFAGDAFGSSWNNAPYNDATRSMEIFSCKRPKPFFCDPGLTRQLNEMEQILPEAERLEAMRQVARAYHDAAPSLFLVEQLDLYAHQPELRGVQVRNRVPVYDAISPAH
jgi:peptide/nickel transport system substrate-binding protein